MVASVIGFLGNEGVAIFRIRVGRQIGSAALIADGYHARVDGWTSLAVLVGTIGVSFGYPFADPAAGLLISAAIAILVWRSTREIVLRMLDGVETEAVDQIGHAARHVTGVKEVSDVRARWIGHRLHADVSVTVSAELSVAAGHTIAREVRHRLLHHLLSSGYRICTRRSGWTRWRCVSSRWRTCARWPRRGFTRLSRLTFDVSMTGGSADRLAWGDWGEAVMAELALQAPTHWYVHHHKAGGAHCPPAAL
jgi:Cation efflux family/Dimerisation domain of Zinc Transporter